MKQKKSKTIKKVKQSVKTPSTQAVVVQPIHLPVVTEVSKPKSFKRVIYTIFMLIACVLVWTYLFYKAVEIYNDYCNEHRSVPMIKTPKKKQNVVAVVGNEEITLDQVKAFVAEIPQLAEVPFDQVYPNILEMMINDKVVANGAKRYGIPKDPSIKKMIKMAGDQIIAQAYFNKELEHALTEADLRAAYDEEVSNFKPQEEIHSRHILLPTEKQAQDVLIQLKAGADFGLLADQKSIDKNAPKGDLGYFTKDMMIPEFAEAVFAMKKGQLSGPIHTAYGWHVVLLEDRRETQAPAFETVKEQIRPLAMERKIPEIIQAERVRQHVRVLRPTLKPLPAPQKPVTSQGK